MNVFFKNQTNLLIDKRAAWDKNTKEKVRDKGNTNIELGNRIDKKNKRIEAIKTE